jgi:hypothetical protein
MLIYVGCLTVLSIGLAVGLALSGYGIETPWLVGALALLGALAERGSLRLTPTLEVSVASVPTLFAAVALGPLAGMVVAAAAMLGDFRAPYMKWAVYTAGRPIPAGLAGLAAVSVEGAVNDQLGAIVIGTAAAALTYELLDVGLAVLTVRIRRSGSALGLLRVGLPIVPAALLYVALIAPLVIAYTELSPWAVVLFLFPALAAQRLFTMYQDQRRLAQDLSAANQSLERANLSFASALVTKRPLYSWPFCCRGRLCTRYRSRVGPPR